MPPTPVIRENIDYFILEIKKMRLLMYLKQAFDESNIQKMRDNCSKLSQLSGMDYIKEIIEKMNTNDINLLKPLVGNVISSIINPNLSNANPIIIYDTESNLFSSIKGWSCNSLLTAMYVMIYLDFAQGTKNRKCENVTCDKWFPIYANDERKIYCDLKCAQAQASREYRLRKKNRDSGGKK